MGGGVHLEFFIKIFIICRQFVLSGNEDVAGYGQPIPQGDWPPYHGRFLSCLLSRGPGSVGPTFVICPSSSCPWPGQKRWLLQQTAFLSNRFLPRITQGSAGSESRDGCEIGYIGSFRGAHHFYW